MGEIFEAYVVLNQTLNLGLKMQDLMRAEGTFKSLMAERINLPKELRLNQDKLTQGFEYKGQLVPRARAMDQNTLSRLGAATASKLTKDLGQLKLQMNQLNKFNQMQQLNKMNQLNQKNLNKLR
ncbi:MAG: hypothetical protein KC563_05250 [Nitrospira sp.]|nr:hypothetical protein [Nitrospira sp.]MCB9710977.1 hypothetical protein [Nitrospiraceae bacterium]MDR4489123.1 hypothetical protein [Nitrospirales bacterium]MCA9464270.1 hypothetical protein [Nitrospira sp.]MCA9475199.1 hypothetical protein [Nitrospira sp.]